DAHFPLPPHHAHALDGLHKARRRTEAGRAALLRQRAYISRARPPPHRRIDSKARRLRGKTLRNGPRRVLPPAGRAHAPGRPARPELREENDAPGHPGEYRPEFESIDLR